MKISSFLIVALLCAGALLPVGAQTKPDSLLVDSMMRQLPEVMVKGERPIAVVKGSSISYDLPRLIEKKNIDNVYDAIRELPGIVEQGGAYSLAGRAVMVSLNGQVLSAEQVASLLKSLPASRIERAEVMYSAPAQTQVRGALINIRLRKETATGAPLEGEVNLAYNQQHRARYGERVSLLFRRGRMSLDAMYLHSHGKTYGVTDEASLHTLYDGSRHEIDNHQTLLSQGFGHNYRLGAEYVLGVNHSLSLVYQGSYNHADSRSRYVGSITGNTLTMHRTWLHNLRLDYVSPFGLKTGLETTYYHDPESQNLSSILPAGTMEVLMDNDQRINMWKLYLSQECKLGNNWTVNYGAWGKLSVNHSLQHTLSESVDRMSFLRQKEEIFNLYAGLGKNFGNKWMVDLSLATEYDHSLLWHRWHVYPTLNLTFLPRQGQTWVFSLTTNRAYPEFWAMNHFTVYGNGGYDEITGNPNLRPSDSYQAQLVCLLKNKYQLAAWYNYTDDYFVQTLYQQPDRLSVLFRTLNFNYQQQAGLQAVLPHRFGSWLDSRLTLIGVWMRERCDDFYDIPFSRAVCYGMVQLNNVVTLSTQPDLSLTADAMVRSRAKQAIYDLSGSGYLNLGSSWRFWRNQAMLHAFYNDVFRTSVINPRIDYKGQRLSMSFKAYSEIGVSLTFRLGGYKEIERGAVDTSRFRK